MGLTQQCLAYCLDIEAAVLAAWENGQQIPTSFAAELVDEIRHCFPGEVDLVRDEHNELVLPLRVGGFPSWAHTVPDAIDRFLDRSPD